MIGIRNMKMPRDCYECNFFDVDSNLGETDYYCLAADKKIEGDIEENCHANVCPLVNIEIKTRENDKEFHWYEAPEPYTATSVSFSYRFTKKYIDDEEPIIRSYQSAFFSQDTIRKGYKLFAHFANGKVVEVYNGMITAAGKEVRPEHNLERMLLAGSFGELE